MCLRHICDAAHVAHAADLDPACAQGVKTPARVPAAVAAFLRDRSVSFREAQPGLLEITASNSGHH